MPEPTARSFFGPVQKQFEGFAEPVPEPQVVEAIARVVAGRLRMSQGAWPFPLGTAYAKTVAFFVYAFVRRQGPETTRDRVLLTPALRWQLAEHGERAPDPLHFATLVQLAVGVLLSHSLPPPRAAPLEAARLLAEFYVTGKGP